ncbi:hypothetical protein PP918_gp53 [Pseudomonas phage UFJF_PfDIW6]|uniref:Uncharacterized protein n=1 Tax=Pseudomonas phage UFJF_PfDIW6 TaxID=2927622 RepID=A0AAE9GCH2_9CAUD|nr:MULTISPECIES: hypothetical protein [unclassified Pseudomonas]YP_010660735.1 hypothetical protein PP918_gp53 [Pseudomonas phage UFJF_PfDIW6]MBJ2282210.1 hypothetical protein [Pseudomonas sp. MF6767]UNY42261.1 hypothetical protein UFJFPfDIW6_00053 [Pseudomonas phage UFJF_PfDIW6]
MNDQELMELAAKAAGMSPASFDGHNVGWYDPQRGTTGTWNPLTDDGDAFRLMVALSLDVAFDGDHCVQIDYFGSDGELYVVEQLVLGDPADAVRRVIVRTAAEIEMGKSLTC